MDIPTDMEDVFKMTGPLSKDFGFLLIIKQMENFI
jgi:hypothetical protein